MSIKEKELAEKQALGQERYHKLRAWMIGSAKLYAQSETPGRAGVMLYGPTFEAAVDSLPEPEEK